MNLQKNNYEMNLNKNAANFVPLSPVTFIERTKDVYPDYTSVIYGNRTYTWIETYNRCLRFASALERHGIGLGDTVSIMAANTPEIFEAHYSVPMTGAVLNTLNTRVEADTIAYILDHGDAKAFIVDTQFSPVVKEALRKFKKEILIIDIEDLNAKMQKDEGERLGKYTYEEFLEQGDIDYQWKKPKDEWQAITLNYTSVSAVQLIPELVKEGHPLNKLWKKVNDAGLVEGVCRACSHKLGTLQAAQEQRLTLLDDMSGHPSISGYREQGYEIITF